MILTRKSLRLHGSVSGNTRDPGSGRLVRSIRQAISSGIISGELARTFQGWARTWNVPELSENVTIRFNARLRTTIARWVIESNRLEVGSRFFALRGDQPQILCHEFAHAAAVLKHGRSVRPHGPEWRWFVRLVGFEPLTSRVSRRSVRAGPKPIRTRVLYEHRCIVCQAVRYAKKPVKSWRCVECIGAGLGGDLKIEVTAHIGATR